MRPAAVVVGARMQRSGRMGQLELVLALAARPLMQGCERTRTASSCRRYAPGRSIPFTYERFQSIYHNRPQDLCDTHVPCAPFFFPTVRALTVPRVHAMITKHVRQNQPKNLAEISCKDSQVVDVRFAAVHVTVCLHARLAYGPDLKHARQWQAS